MLIECNATPETIMEMFSDKTKMYHGTGVAILIEEIRRLREHLDLANRRLGELAHAECSECLVLREELARYKTPNVDNVTINE